MFKPVNFISNSMKDNQRKIDESKPRALIMFRELGTSARAVLQVANLLCIKLEIHWG